MLRVTFLTAAATLLGAGTSLALGWAFGGTYFAGIPVGESKITAVHYGGETIPVDMTDGWPFKPGPVNFALTSLAALTPAWSVEAGFEWHGGYKNKEATIKSDEGQSFVEPEDNVEWSLWNVYGGPRFTFQPGAKVRPFVAGGVILGRSEYELKDRGGTRVEVRSTGTAFGGYVGGGAAVYLSDNVALTFPVKFHILLGAEYEYEGSLDDFSNEWQPGPYVTAGVGVTYAPFNGR